MYDIMTRLFLGFPVEYLDLFTLVFPSLVAVLICPALLVFLQRRNLFPAHQVKIALIVSYAMFCSLVIPLSWMTTGTKETKKVAAIVSYEHGSYPMELKVCRERETVGGDWKQWKAC